MKVQIEIPQKAVNMAKLSLTFSSNDPDELGMIDKAIERCNNEVTEIDLEEYDKDMMIRACIALAAIAKRGLEIESEEEA